MNLIDGKRMSDIFFKYYNRRLVEKEDVDMLNKLELTKYIEYSIVDGKAYAEATYIGRGMHPLD